MSSSFSTTFKSERENPITNITIAQDLLHEIRHGERITIELRANKILGAEGESVQLEIVSIESKDSTDWNQVRADTAEKVSNFWEGVKSGLNSLWTYVSSIELEWGGPNAGSGEQVESEDMGDPFYSGNSKRNRETNSDSESALPFQSTEVKLNSSQRNSSHVKVSQSFDDESTSADKTSGCWDAFLQCLASSFPATKYPEPSWSSVWSVSSPNETAASKNMKSILDDSEDESMFQDIPQQETSNNFSWGNWNIQTIGSSIYNFFCSEKQGPFDFHRGGSLDSDFDSDLDNDIDLRALLVEKEPPQFLDNCGQCVKGIFEQIGAFFHGISEGYDALWAEEQLIGTLAGQVTMLQWGEYNETQFKHFCENLYTDNRQLIKQWAGDVGLSHEKFCTHYKIKMKRHPTDNTAIQVFIVGPKINKKETMNSDLKSYEFTQTPNYSQNTYSSSYASNINGDFFSEIQPSPPDDRFRYPSSINTNRSGANSPIANNELDHSFFGMEENIPQEPINVPIPQANSVMTQNLTKDQIQPTIPLIPINDLKDAVPQETSVMDADHVLIMQESIIKLPNNEREGIYRCLSLLLRPEGDGNIQHGESAFHDLNGLSSTPGEKKQAWENYYKENQKKRRRT